MTAVLSEIIIVLFCLLVGYLTCIFCMQRAQNDAFPTELDDDEHTLAYYGVSDGADILMNEIDVADRQRQQQKAEQAREAKIMQQQEQDLQKQRQLQRLKQGGQ